ncbi:hypothetical protein P0Y35_06575 [Kiritimatiellaeota bacterium B1221]|nr:hypothetical protein [Kiritimatiellaeota bacterium B1221]
MGNFFYKRACSPTVQAYTFLINTLHDTSPHFTVRIENHLPRERLEVELIDPPFPSRIFELRVNGSRPSQLSYATKTQIWDRLRKWMVQHNEVLDNPMTLRVP